MALTADIVVEQIPQAIARLSGRTPVASAARTAEWERVALALRDRAFWSASIEDIRVLSRARQLLDEWAGLDPALAYRSRPKFVAEMRAILGAPEGDSGRLTDLESRRRLELIYNFQTTEAAEFARWTVGQDADVLDAFPCQELVRVEARQEPRDWLARWRAAGGQMFAGRMIARKDDPIWTQLSRFGQPWPPFDFGSGMGVADVGRDEAEALGVIAPTDRVAPQQRGFNDQLQASLAGIDAVGRAELRALFGDQIARQGDTVKWQGQVVGDLFDSALANPAAKRSVDLGQATARANGRARWNLPARSWGGSTS